jgi:hypothetical protein
MAVSHPKGLLVEFGSFAFKMLAGLALVGALFVGGCIWRMKAEINRFDRPKLEAVVALVRALNLPPGKEHFLSVDSLENPTMVRPYTDHRGHRVWAETGPSGKLSMAIETVDHGHAGHFGFAYSDEPLTLLKGTYGDFVSVPGSLSVAYPDGRIDDHWWQVRSID